MYSSSFEVVYFLKLILTLQNVSCFRNPQMSTEVKVGDLFTFFMATFVAGKFKRFNFKKYGSVPPHVLGHEGGYC